MTKTYTREEVQQWRDDVAYAIAGMFKQHYPDDVITYNAIRGFANKAPTPDRDAMRLALEEIANPIDFMIDQAKAEGNQINGAMAIQLASNSEYYKEIARRCLESVNNG